MTLCAIIQARMTSTRLPGKVLSPLYGQPVLARVIERLGRAQSIDAIAVATTVNATDDPIAALTAELSVPCFRGSESDVLSRYLGTARMMQADAVIRITADCPLIDPAIVDLVASAFASYGADYAANTLTRSYPIGLDTEIFTFAALDRAQQSATRPDEREHVTPYIYRHPEFFSLHGIDAPPAHRHPNLRLTLDTPEDLQLITAVYDALYPENPEFCLDDVLTLLGSHPDLAKINQDVPHNWIMGRP
ncbi:glycosyltransferase family protein [bacterium SCSIO 12827]|nr:glycosyltransferase family protein [bacterium SCSIO 12827]